MADLDVVQRRRRRREFSIRGCAVSAVFGAAIGVAMFSLAFRPASAGFLALGATSEAVLSVGVYMSVAKPHTRRRLALSAPLLVCAVALFFALIHKAPNGGYAFAREIERAVATKCPSDRQDQARAILDRWFDGTKPTTINCAPDADIGAYGNGFLLSVAVVGRVDPACPVPRDITFWVRGPSLVLHYCESPPSA
jgi:hypothetical protein